MTQRWLYIVERPTDSQRDPWATDLETLDIEEAMARGRAILEKNEWGFQIRRRALYDGSPSSQFSVSEELKP